MDSKNQEILRFVEAYLKKAKVWMIRKNGTSYPKALMEKLRTLGYIQ
jgi:hypothetical protein